MISQLSKRDCLSRPCKTLATIDYGQVRIAQAVMLPILDLLVEIVGVNRFNRFQIVFDFLAHAFNLAGSDQPSSKNIRFARHSNG